MVELTDDEQRASIVQKTEEKIIPTFTLELVKESQRTLQPSKVKEQANYVVERILTGGRQKVWDVDWKEEPSSYVEKTRTTTYKLTFKLTPKNYIEGKTETQFNTVKEYVETAANTQRWQLSKYGDEIFIVEKQPIELVVPEDWYGAYFSHIYEREPQIKMVMSAINAAIQSRYENRFHVVLYGPAACGKTEITRTFVSMFGDEAVLEYDATATTQAGAIKDLKERENTPRILVVEEIEKTEESALRWLLALLDHRAEIRKTNYRETVQREIKLLCIATVNDFELFSKLMYGALASRFAHKIYCPRPNEAILTRILTREIERLPDAENPDFLADARQWIKPAIKFALDHNMNDPRQVTAICLSGGQELVTGRYQEMLEECMGPESIKDVMNGAIKTPSKPKEVMKVLNIKPNMGKR